MPTSDIINSIWNPLNRVGSKQHVPAYSGERERFNKSSRYRWTFLSFVLICLPSTCLHGSYCARHRCLPKDGVATLSTHPRYLLLSTLCVFASLMFRRNVHTAHIPFGKDLFPLRFFLTGTRSSSLCFVALFRSVVDVAAITGDIIRGHSSMERERERKRENSKKSAPKKGKKMAGKCNPAAVRDHRHEPDRNSVRRRRN